MNKVLIMLSTYNGHKYLREQLDSLYAQEEVEIHILVRDDGSKDDTLEILKDYKEHKGKMTILPTPNVGAAKSFHLIAHYALTEMRDFNYYAFCDQDDVWLKDKLYKSCISLDKSTALYKLFYGPATLVDRYLNPLGASSFMIVNNLEANIFASRSLGCTQVFNKALLEKFVSLFDYVSNANPNDFIPLHDGWMSLIAYALDADVIVGDEPLMLYRQHGHNVVGANENYFERTTKRLKRFFRGSCPKSSKCKLVLNVLGNDIPQENYQLLDLCANYKDSVVKRIKLATTSNMYQYSVADNIGLWATIVTGTF